MKHATLDQLRSLSQEWAFGFVRNPWDWKVSLFSYYCQRPPRNSTEFRRQEGLIAAGFKKWLLQPYSTVTPIVQARSQMSWLQGCDDVGLFEHIEDEFEDIAGYLECKHHRLGRANGYPHADFRTLYDQETIDFVAKCCKPEIEEFGYTW